jgi:hypothetical protein
MALYIYVLIWWKERTPVSSAPYKGTDIIVGALCLWLDLIWHDLYHLKLCLTLELFGSHRDGPPRQTSCFQASEPEHKTYPLDYPQQCPILAIGQWLKCPFSQHLFQDTRLSSLTTPSNGQWTSHNEKIHPLLPHPSLSIKFPVC